MDSLDDIFEKHKKTVLAVLDMNKIEIEASLKTLSAKLDDHDCSDSENAPEVTIDDVIEFIEDDDGDCYPDIMRAMEIKGAYVLVAKNMNEQARIEKFIEELKTNPYLP